MQRCIAAASLLVLCTPCAARTYFADTLSQSPDTSAILPLEDIAEQLLGTEMDSDLFERLVWFREHPIELNETGEDELLALPGISMVAAGAIQRYRRTHGPFKSAFDLAGIEGVTSRVWATIRPFVTVSPRRVHMLALRSRVLRPLPGTPGADTSYMGPNVSRYVRAVVSPARGWESGVVGVADAGERLRDGALSGYVQHESAGCIRQIILGDFQATAGLGLLWGQGVRRDAFLNAPVSGSFIPHRSSGEQGFLRGAGVSLGIPAGSGEVRACLFAARTPCAASIDSLDEITSLAAGGAYRSARAVERRNAALFSCVGGRVEFRAPGTARIGVSAVQSWFDHAIKFDRPFELSGKGFGTLGIDGQAAAGLARCALEYAISQGGMGIAALVTMSVGKRCAAQLLVRYCQPGFHSPLALGGGFGEAVRNSSEVRWSLETPLPSDSYLQAEVLQFRRPWRSTGGLFPTGGREIAGEAGVHLAKGFRLTVRGEERWIEQGIRTAAGARPGTAIADEARRRIHCTANFTRGVQWRLRGRIEILRFTDPVTGADEHGWMAAGEVRWEPARWIAVAGRVTLFQSESYGSRLYAIETTLEGLSGLTLLSGTGRRWYCHVMCRPLPDWRISAHYASTERVVGGRSNSRDAQFAVQVDFQIDPP